jgi:hypothetical protein
LIDEKRKYVVVNTVVTYKHQYVIPMDQLQDLNPDSPVEAAWAADTVVMEEANPTATKMIGENIVDIMTVDEPTAYAFVRMDNPHYGDVNDEFVAMMIDSWKR